MYWKSSNQFPSQGFSLCILLSKNGRSKSSMPWRNLHACIFTNVQEKTGSVEVGTLMTHPEAPGLGPYLTQQFSLCHQTQGKTQLPIQVSSMEKGKNRAC